MRSRKASDSPSGATRDVYALRAAHPPLELGRYLMQVNREAQRMLAREPGLATESPGDLLSRVVAQGSLAHDVTLARAAAAVLLLVAVDRAETVSPFTGGEAA